MLPRHLFPFIAAIAIALVFGGTGAGVVLWSRGLLSEGWATVAAAFLGAFAAPYFAEWLRHRVFAPKLEVTISTEPPWWIGSRDLTGDGLMETQKWVHWFRFRVANNGIGRANDTEVALNRIWVEKNGEWRPIQFWQPVNLKWSGLDTRLLTLNRGQHAYCDLGYVPAAVALRNYGYQDWPGNPARSRLILNIDRPYKAQPSALPEGDYRVEVLAFAANASPLTVVVEIEFHPQWDTLGHDAEAGRGPVGVTVRSVSPLFPEGLPLRSGLDLVQLQYGPP